MNIKNIIKKSIIISERIGLRGKRSFLRSFAVGRLFVDLLLLPSDLVKIFFSYKAKFGVYPNLIRPRRFNEYLQRWKITKRKKIYTSWADKFLVRSYVKSKIGEDYLIPLLWSGNDLRDVDISKLPKSFIIKTNQGCGTNIIVLDRDSFDWGAAYVKTDWWLLNDHSVCFAEWQYRWIEPMIIIEELLVGSDGKLPVDYKFYCFKGRVEFLLMVFDRYDNMTKNIYDRDFNLMPFNIQYPNYCGGIEKPRCFDKMIELAETLSDSEAFVRVDFYDFDGPVFGEITLHPEAGLLEFNPEEFNLKLGRMCVR